MKNDFKIQKDKLVSEAIAKEPKFIDAKKYILKMCIVLLIARAIFVIVETSYVISNDLSLSLCTINYVSLFIGFLFVFMIYNGSKPFVYLIIIGGIYSLINYFIKGFTLNSDDVFYNIYNIIFIGTMIVQMVSMSLILMNKMCQKYFNVMDSINKQLIEQNKKKS